MKRTLLIIILTLVTLAQAGAYPTFEKNGIDYNIMSGDSTVSVTTGGQFNESCYTGHIVIPSSVRYNDKNYEVSQIGMYAFANDTELLSISLPNTIKDIEDGSGMYYGKGAFESCTGLTSIVVTTLIDVLLRGGSSDVNCDGIINIADVTALIDKL